jgi:hypothetical protein
MRNQWNRGRKRQESPEERVRISRGCGREASRVVQPEFDIVLLPNGAAIFSWNSADIQEMAGLLGSPEFETSRWCG